MPQGGGAARGAIWMICLLAALGGALRAWSVAHHVAVDFDEGRYLDNARNILEGRGLSTNYTSHFFRTAAPRHPEDISSPLYPWLLAGTFRLTGVELRPAQVWSWVAGTALIPLTFIYGRRLFGVAAGLVAAALVALNPDMIIISSWAMTEMLYAVMLLAVLLMADRLTREAGTLRPARLIFLGITCGALYLMRANGLAVAAALGIWCLWPREGEPLLGRGVLRSRLKAAGPGLMAAVALSAGFLACVSPWLARNQALFGSPTWSAMKHVAWSESGTDLFTRNEPAPSMAAFAAEHGTPALARHMAHRAARAVGFLIWGDTGAFNVICAMLPLAAILTWSLPRARPGMLVIFFSTCLLAGVPLWTGAPSRYLLPVRPIIYAIVAGAVFGLLGRVAGRAAAAIGALVLMVGLVSASPLRAWLEGDQAAREAVGREAAAFVEKGTEPDAVLLEGALLHQYAFLFDRPVVWTPTGGLPEIERAARDYGARYIAVSAELMATRPELKQHFDLGARREVMARELPVGWQEVFAGSGRRIVIYRMTLVQG